MPIGKNSIKRVQNAGYSKVTTSAPDMENSHVAEETVTPAEEKKTAAKKSAQKTTIIDLTVSIKDSKQLESMISRLMKHGDIEEVFRTSN